MKKYRLRNLKLNEISSVDRPAQTGAVSVLLKRADPTAPKPAVVILKATFAEAFTGMLLNDRISDVFWSAFQSKYEADRAFQTALVDDLSAGGDGTTPSADYIAAVSGMAAAAVAAARAIGAQATDLELAAAVDKAVADYVAQKETTTMTITTKAALLAAVTAFDPATGTIAKRDEIWQAAKTLGLESELPAAGPLAKAADPSAQIADLQAQLAKRDKLGAMSPEVRKHYDGLAEADQTAFLAKSVDEQATVVADINKGDPILYTTVDGIEIRKSDGAAALALAKKLDAQEATIKALSATNEQSEIAKAIAKYPHIAANIVKRMVKSAEGGTAEDRQEVDAALDQMNKRQRPLFAMAGLTADDIEKGDTPDARMQRVVKRIAKAENVTEAQAEVLARGDPEYAEAYNESVAAPTRDE